MARRAVDIAWRYIGGALHQLRLTTPKDTTRLGFCFAINEFNIYPMRYKSGCESVSIVWCVTAWAPD